MCSLCPLKKIMHESMSKLGPPNPSLYLHAECSEVVSNENWIKIVIFIVSAWLVEVFGVVES